MPDPIINLHAHIHTDQDIDARVRHWRECGVCKTCVQSLAWKPNEQTHDNDGVAAWMKKYPEMILGFACINLGWEPDGPEAVDRYHAQGFTGLKFIAPSYRYDDERYYPLYRRAEELQMPILFHTGYLAIGPLDGSAGVSSEKMRPLLLDPVARAFPRLKIIMAHLGNPEYDVGLYVTMEFANIYGEFSGGGGQPFKETTMRKVFEPLPGANLQDENENQAIVWFRKLCFATDNPEPPKWIDLCQRLMDRLELPADVRERFWWRNAAELLGLEDVE